MLALIIPWLLALLAIVSIVCLISKKWKAALFLILMTLALNWWSGCFCFGNKTSCCGDFKILSFNIDGADVYNDNKTESIISIINKENPDVIFLTENFMPIRDTILERLHNMYPYDIRYMAHNIIFSKLPLFEKTFHERPNGGNGYIVHSKVMVNDTPLFLYGCHLSSNNYSSDLDYLTPSDIRSFSDIRTYIKNVSVASRMRELEADIIVQSFSETDKVIVMGDFNDICGSETMRTFSNVGLKDAWSEGGFGYGATIHYPLPYRIDHILHNEGLVLKGVKVIDTSDISDHNALVAVFDFSN